MHRLGVTVTSAGCFFDLSQNIDVSMCLFSCATGLNTDPQLTPGSPCGAASAGSGCSQDGVGYFSVMWCKASKKKHKRWEGDAVLVTRGRTATLKDMEGKDIGKGEREI